MMEAVLSALTKWRTLTLSVNAYSTTSKSSPVSARDAYEKLTDPNAGVLLTDHNHPMIIYLHIFNHFILYYQFNII